MEVKHCNSNPNTLIFKPRIIQFIYIRTHGKVTWSMLTLSYFSVTFTFIYNQDE